MRVSLVVKRQSTIDSVDLLPRRLDNQRWADRLISGGIGCYVGLTTRSASRGGVAMRLVVPLLLSAVAALSAGCGRGQPGTPKGSPPNEEAVVVFRAADGRTSRWPTCNC